MLISTGRLCDRPGCPGTNHPSAKSAPPAPEAAIKAAQQAQADASSAPPHPLTPYRQQLDAQIGDLARMFEESGHSFYLVGGMVRDGALGLPLDHDIDITTDARPEQTKAIMDRWTDQVWDQGARYGTVAARKGSADVEVTTFRSETYQHDSRKPDVRFSDDVTTDLSRRDFTINSMAVALPTWELLDPFGGMSDLRARRLHTPSDPSELFNDDPLRMMRAARFIARFDLNADPEVTQAILENRDRIRIVSSERIGAEIGKLLSLRRSQPGIDYLHETGVLNSFLAGIDEEAVSQIGKMDTATTDPPEVRWAALLGKDRSPEAAVRLMSKRFSVDHVVNQRTKSVLRAAEDLRAITNDASDIDLRRVAAHHDRGCQAAAISALRAWDQAHDDRLLQRLSHIEEHDGPALRQPPIEGHQVAALVGGPGRQVGDALRLVREHQIEHGPVDAQQARNVVIGMSGRAPRS